MASLSVIGFPKELDTVWSWPLRICQSVSFQLQHASRCFYLTVQHATKVARQGWRGWQVHPLNQPACSAVEGFLEPSKKQLRSKPWQDVKTWKTWNLALLRISRFHLTSISVFTSHQGPSRRTPNDPASDELSQQFARWIRPRSHKTIKDTFSTELWLLFEKL